MKQMQVYTIKCLLDLINKLDINTTHSYKIVNSSYPLPHDFHLLYVGLDKYIIIEVQKSKLDIVSP